MEKSGNLIRIEFANLRICESANLPIYSANSCFADAATDSPSQMRLTVTDCD